MSQIKFEQGDKVEWKWGSGTASGKITEVFTKSVTKTIKGSEITRNGTDSCPALMIEQENGDKVLKLASEIEKIG